MAQSTTKNSKPARQDAPQQAPAGNLPASQQQTAPAPAEKEKLPIVQFRDYVIARMATLEEALPPTIPPKRFVSVVMTALQNKPKLLECTFPSLWNACVRAAQDGLLPDGREGAIAPYGENKDGRRVAEIATWMPMVEGYRKKIFETGKVASWDVQVVRERDSFDYELGDNAFIKHRPHIGKESAGGIVGAYSIAKLTNGEKVYEVMGAFDIMQIAGKSKAGNGPWKDPIFVPEMARKVVARRHYKQLPHTESMDAMIARDDVEHGLLDEQTPRIPQPTKRTLPPRDAFGAYANYVSRDVIDHDTGEIFEPGEFSDQDRADFEREASPVSNVGASRGADTASTPSGEKASAPDNKQVANSADTPATAAVSEGAGAVETTSSAPAPTDTAPGAAEGEREKEHEDGDDRRWPNGATPTTDAEYASYLKTTLADMSGAPSQVAVWFRSETEKQLREACGVAENFNAYQALAMQRRNELADLEKSRK